MKHISAKRQAIQPTYQNPDAGKGACSIANDTGQVVSAGGGLCIPLGVSGSKYCNIEFVWRFHCNYYQPDSL